MNEPHQQETEARETAVTRAPSTLHGAALTEIARLESFAGRVRRHLALRGGLVLAGGALAAAFGTLLLDRALRLGSGTRLFIGLAVALWLGVLAWRHLVLPLRGHWSTLDLAGALDQAKDGDTFLAQRFASLLQFDPERAGAAESDERVFRLRALATDCDELAAHDYESRLDRPGHARRKQIVIGLAVLPLLFTIVFPDTAGIWARRWLLGQDARWPQRTYLEVEGLAEGRLFVVRGDPFEIRVRAREGSEVPGEVRITYESETGNDVRAVLRRFGDNDFRHAFDGITDETRFWLRGGDDRQGPHVLVPRERPRVLGLELVASLPAAGVDESHTFEVQDRALAYLPGTRLVVTGTTSAPISSARATGKDGVVLDARMESNERFVFEWTHAAPMSLKLEAFADETGLASRGHALTIGLAADRAPRVTLSRTGVSERVTPQARVPLTALLQDDFGIDAARLEVRSGTSPRDLGEPRVVVLRDAGGAREDLERSQEAAHELALAALELVPGQLLRIEAVAVDRCHLGAQETRSRPVDLRVVEPGLLLAEIVARLQQSRARFRASWEDARGLLEAYRLAMQASGEADHDWGDSLRRHRLVDRTVWSTDRTVGGSLTELALNGLIEDFTERELREQVLEPLTTLLENELRDQRVALEGRFSGQSVPLTEVEPRQGAIVDTMEAVLEAMSRWDSFVDLVNQLNELIRMQQEVRGETQDAKDG